MIISSSYPHTIARLQHLFALSGREGEEPSVTDGTPREQIDEGETRRVLAVVMKDASFARVTGVEASHRFASATNTLNLRALVRQGVSPER